MHSSFTLCILFTLLILLLHMVGAETYCFGEQSSGYLQPHRYFRGGFNIRRNRCKEYGNGMFPYVRIPLKSRKSKVTLSYTDGSCKSRAFVTLQSNFNESSICETDFFWNYGVATSFRIQDLQVPSEFDVIVSSSDDNPDESCCFELDVSF